MLAAAADRGDKHEHEHSDVQFYLTPSFVHEKPAFSLQKITPTLHFHFSVFCALDF